MKGPEFGRIGKRLLSVLPPGFTSRGHLVFVAPVEHTYRGLLFDSSRHSRDGFYVHTVVQPMCMPEEHFVLNLGWRIGGGVVWDASSQDVFERLSAAVVREAIPFAGSISTAGDAASALGRLGKDGDPLVVRATAYAWAREGRLDAAATVLERLEQLVAPHAEEVPAKRAWLQEAHTLRQLFKTPDLLRQRLDQWAQATATNIGVSLT